MIGDISVLRDSESAENSMGLFDLDWLLFPYLSFRLCRMDKIAFEKS